MYLIRKVIEDAQKEVNNSLRDKEYAPFKDGVKIKDVNTGEEFTLDVHKNNYYLVDKEGNSTPIALDEDFLDRFEIVAIPTKNTIITREEVPHATRHTYHHYSSPAVLLLGATRK